MQNCQDTFSATFASFNELFGYQQQVSSRSQWSHCAVNQLHVEPLNHNSSCCPALKEFAPGVSSEVVEDSFNKLGLAIRFNQKYGTQFEVYSCDEVINPSREGIIGYSNSGQIKGIGPRIAEKIYDAYTNMELYDMIFKKRKDVIRS